MQDSMGVAKGSAILYMSRVSSKPQLPCHTHTHASTPTPSMKGINIEDMGRNKGSNRKTRQNNRFGKKSIKKSQVGRRLVNLTRT